MLEEMVDFPLKFRPWTYLCENEILLRELENE